MSLILSPKPILFSVKANTAPTIHQDLYRICEDTPIGAYEYKQIENSLKIHEWHAFQNKTTIFFNVFLQVPLHLL